ncbi:MAG TPA: AbrB/MazE/SpoVT family DNA-binding domain-containing protein [Candidatus Angelobacter sp.]|jgi:bifunctional DNA-binding transcriptional regulator/antitoxin component of YhaV-PrlF toxin-antitoxin module|nr:AbrB/MazE/SpoVT family DNA-binding domain-containing protein [Candidatus Angelobacter sp.]
MSLTEPKVRLRKFIRFRERNQITLPNEIISGMAIGTGDFLEISLMEDGSIRLKPTLLVTSVNSPEAQHQEALADEDIESKNYKTFHDAHEVMDDLNERRSRKRKAPAAVAVTPAAASVNK